jgi:hypothetical protein
MKTIFRASDGKEFPTKELCMTYESSNECRVKEIFNKCKGDYDTFVEMGFVLSKFISLDGECETNQYRIGRYNDVVIMFECERSLWRTHMKKDSLVII